MALLEADVNFKVVKEFTKRTKERCLTAEVLDSLTPAQNVVKIVLDELTALMGEESKPLQLSSRIPNRDHACWFAGFGQNHGCC